MVCSMTLIVDKSIRKGLAVWKLCLFGGLVFTIPEVLIANLVGPELPSLLGSLIAIPIFIFAVRRNYFLPKDKWDFKSRDEWKDDWEGKIKAGTSENAATTEVMSAKKAWVPYVLIGILLLLSRLRWLPFKDLLNSWSISWNNILGTSISNGITPYTILEYSHSYLLPY